MKTKSSVMVGVALSHELRRVVEEVAAARGATLSHFVRDAILESLKRSGVDVSCFNNPHQGERIDLKEKVFREAKRRKSEISHKGT